MSRAHMTGHRSFAATSERIDPGLRPPDALIPPVFADLIAEYDRINKARGDAENVVLRFNDGWDQQLAAARKDDTEANARAARAGSFGEISTQRADALVAARASAVARLASLDDARTKVANDFYQLMADEQSNDAYGKAVDVARAALVKAAAPLQAAITKAVQARAAYEWVHAQQWDANEAIPLPDLCPQVLNVGPDAHTLPPVSAAHLIAALTQIAD